MAWNRLPTMVALTCPPLESRLSTWSREGGWKAKTLSPMPIVSPDSRVRLSPAETLELLMRTEDPSVGLHAEISLLPCNIKTFANIYIYISFGKWSLRWALTIFSNHFLSPNISSIYSLQPFPLTISHHKVTSPLSQVRTQWVPSMPLPAMLMEPFGPTVDCPACTEHNVTISFFCGYNHLFICIISRSCWK